MIATDSGKAALDTIRVLDLTTNHTAYAARLLSDLGAHVVRPVLDGEPEAPDMASLFLHAGSHAAELDQADRDGLARLVAASDLIFESSAFGGAHFAFDPSSAMAEGRARTVVSFSPFGLGVNLPATDLTIMASGGLLSLGGYADTEPLAIGGEQSLLAAGIFGAVAALADLIGREDGHSGNWIDVSAQECVAFALEDAVPDFYINGRVRRRYGDVAREAGTGVYPCADGYVSIVAGRLGTAKAWQALRQWIIEVGKAGSEALVNPQWDDFAYRGRPESVARFAQIFAAFSAGLSKNELYVQGQRRQIAVAPVNRIDDLFGDPQLRHSNYFKPFRDAAGRELSIPGAPYRLSRTPARVPAAVAEPHSETIVAGACNEP